MKKRNRIFLFFDKDLHLYSNGIIHYYNTKNEYKGLIRLCYQSTVKSNDGKIDIETPKKKFVLKDVGKGESDKWIE